MNLLDAAALITFLTLAAVLLYGVLTIYVGAHRPGDRPTWGDLFAFVAGVWGAVIGALQRTAQGVVNK